jgi:acetyltransferase-like isoleucine patch superfamily enzyme
MSSVLHRVARWPLRAIQTVGAELRGICAFAIVMWPSTPLGYAVRSWYWRRKLGVRDIIVARGARVTGSEFIRCGEHLAIGENVEFVADGVDGLKVHIGSHILFARGVYLRSSNHVLRDRDRHILDQGHWSKRVHFEGTDYAIVIEDGCWIGANAVIVSGAHIGRGAVIGAGAVVTGVIPAYAVAAGVPARVIGMRP